MKANDRQVGGEHYGLSELGPWDMPVHFIVDANVHSAYAYMVRIYKKGVAQADREKTDHYIDKLLEYRPKPVERHPDTGHTPYREDFVRMAPAGPPRYIVAALLAGKYEQAKNVMNQWKWDVPELDG